ncbi:DNA-binding response regulator [Myxococcaceae bacterium GXIMD 01537]
MRSVLVVSPHRASRELLARVLPEPELKVLVTGDADEAFATLAERRPSLVVVDLRRPGEDEDSPLFLALLRKRHPALPVIALVPGRLRVFDGEDERVQDVQRADPTEGLRVMLEALRESLHDLLAQHVLRVLRPPVGRA